MYSLLIVIIFGGLVAAIAVGIGALAFYKAWHEKRKTQTTRRWFTLNGTILESEVENCPAARGMVHANSGFGCGTATRSETSITRAPIR